MTNEQKQKILESVKFSQHEAYYRLGYDSEKEPGVSKIIEGARGESQALLPIIEMLIKRDRIMSEALEQYTHYDNETVRHMDTEFLQPERIAIIKPIDKIIDKEGCAPEGMHPSQIYQDDVFTYGPKQRPGKIARKAKLETDQLLKEWE